MGLMFVLKSRQAGGVLSMLIMRQVVRYRFSQKFNPKQNTVFVSKNGRS